MTQEEKQMETAIKKAQAKMRLEHDSIKLRYFKRYTPKRKRKCEQVR